MVNVMNENYEINSFPVELSDTQVLLVPKEHKIISIYTDPFNTDTKSEESQVKVAMMTRRTKSNIDPDYVYRHLMLVKPNTRNLYRFESYLGVVNLRGLNIRFAFLGGILTSEEYNSSYGEVVTCLP